MNNSDVERNIIFGVAPGAAIGGLHYVYKKARYTNDRENEKRWFKR
jgi:hypothetical protein